MAEPKPANAGGHFYPGCEDPRNFYTSDCEYGCGCWMGGTRSGGPDGVDPFGSCPNNPGQTDMRLTPLQKALQGLPPHPVFRLPDAEKTPLEDSLEKIEQLDLPGMRLRAQQDTTALQSGTLHECLTAMLEYTKHLQEDNKKLIERVEYLETRIEDAVRDIHKEQTAAKNESAFYRMGLQRAIELLMPKCSACGGKTEWTGWMDDIQYVGKEDEDDGSTE